MVGKWITVYMASGCGGCAPGKVGLRSRCGGPWVETTQIPVSHPRDSGHLRRSLGAQSALETTIFHAMEFELHPTSNERPLEGADFKHL